LIENETADWPDVTRPKHRHDFEHQYPSGRQQDKRFEGKQSPKKQFLKTILSRHAPRTILPKLAVNPLDPLSFAIVPFVLAGASALASVLPASRVAGINPVDALKAE